MGPRTDVDQLKPLLKSMCTNAAPQRLVADGGYDSQHNHRLLREKYNIESIIPATLGRPTDKLPTDRWRYLMATAFDEETYGQRWPVETVMFMLQHHQGSPLTAHTYQTRRRAMGLKAVTHNILILRPIKLFYKAFLTGYVEFATDGVIRSFCEETGYRQVPDFWRIASVRPPTPVTTPVTTAVTDPKGRLQRDCSRA